MRVGLPAEEHWVGPRRPAGPSGGTSDVARVPEAYCGQLPPWPCTHTRMRYSEHYGEWAIDALARAKTESRCNRVYAMQIPQTAGRKLIGACCSLVVEGISRGGGVTLHGLWAVGLFRLP